MKKQVRFRAVFPIKEYVELAMPEEHFKELADSMVGIPFYDSPDTSSVRHIIGKVISAKWVPEKNCIEYEVETGT